MSPIFTRACVVLAVLGVLVAIAGAAQEPQKSIKPGDKLKVTIGPAIVEDDLGKTAATLPAGTEATAVEVEGRRVKITLEKEGAKITGWVDRIRVKAVTPTPETKAAAPTTDDTRPEPTKDGKTLGQWIQQLKSGDLRSKGAAASALYMMGSDARPAAPALAQLLAERTTERTTAEGWMCRTSALMALWYLGAAGEPAVPALMKIVEDRETGKLENMEASLAIMALAEIGPAAKQAIPTLKEVLADSGDAPLRQATTTVALASIGPSPEAIPGLLRCLDYGRGESGAIVRWRAARTLGRMGPAAKAALPALDKALKDEVVHVRIWAAYAKAKINQDPTEALPILKEALKHTNWKVRDRAREALEDLEPKAKELPRLPSTESPSGTPPPKSRAADLGNRSPTPADPLPDTPAAAQEAFVRRIQSIAPGHFRAWLDAFWNKDILLDGTQLLPRFPDTFEVLFEGNKFRADLSQRYLSRLKSIPKAEFRRWLNDMENLEEARRGEDGFSGESERLSFYLTATVTMLQRDDLFKDDKFHKKALDQGMSRR